MASDRFNIETILIALVKTVSPFTTGVLVDHFDSSTDTIANQDRIAIQAAEPTPAVQARAEYVNAPLWESEVQIQMIFATPNTTTLDTWYAALNTALTQATPAAIVTLATSLFPNGCFINMVDSGDRSGAGTDVRNDTKVVKFTYFK